MTTAILILNVELVGRQLILQMICRCLARDSLMWTDNTEKLVDIPYQRESTAQFLFPVWSLTLSITFNQHSISPTRMSITLVTPENCVFQFAQS